MDQLQIQRIRRELMNTDDPDALRAVGFLMTELLQDSEKRSDKLQVILEIQFQTVELIQKALDRIVTALCKEEGGGNAIDGH